ncbi:Hsp70 family protein [Euhalothece natronophila Z-M001]|uniref:Hsp70 family protein n=1 Tax=Euhalothece natronophila Z-M001 TaxID=522448 RepID=A0A5B8NPL2_9CHRO|nr:Hsp70 family protein [Euhalothece natronophila]QDZ41273.1 Hsp70 family protein [Euhalothece natronophila Z-M001]
MTIIAVDFGTTNTVISYLPPDSETPTTVKLDQLSRVFRLRNQQGEIKEVPVIPSLLFIDSSGQPKVGELVRSRRLGLTQPQRFFKGFKQDLVADFQPPPREIDGDFYPPETVCEQFLTTIWQTLQAENWQPTQAVFTVPVGAFERYRHWFWQLSEKLRIPQLQLVDESTAAALGYAQKRPNALILVIDFGGGTLDLSLVRTAFGTNEQELKGEVIAKADAYVGGSDIDAWIVEDYLKSIGRRREEVDETTWQNLLAIAEQLKIRLSGKEEAKESWLNEETFESYEISLQRNHLEEILEVRQLLDQLREVLDDVISTALRKGIQKNEIEQVLLTGGTSLIHAVQNLVISFFGRKRVQFSNPFEAVSHGALVAASLHKLEDYLRHSYAIRLWDPALQQYQYYQLFEKGTTYPCEGETLILQVAVEGQKEIELDIGELAEVSQAGEVSYDAQGRMTAGNINHQLRFSSLAENREQVCVAHLDPVGKVGRDRAAVTFAINERRILVATVTDLLTQQVLVDHQEVVKLR